MKTIAQIIAENPQADDKQVVDLHNAQPMEPRGSAFVTYTLLGTRTDLFGPTAMAVAGALRDAIEAWIAAPVVPFPGRGVLKTINDRLAGATGLDLSDASAPTLIDVLTSGIDEEHPPILTSEIAALLLSIGWVSVTPVDEADVAAARASINLLASLNTLRDQVNAIVGKVDVLFDRYRAGEVFDVPSLQELIG